MENKTKKSRILVAEDDTVYAKIYLRKLVMEGHEVTIVSNGDEAERMMNIQQYDLMLLDLIMPIKDGYEVLEDMMSGKVKYALKTIVMSNLSQEDDIEKAKKAGAIDYFVKANVSISQMVEIVKKYL